MSNGMYLSIPCTYENKVLVIKALGFRGKGDSADQALLECIKNTPYYIPFLLAKFKFFTDHRGRNFAHLEVPFESSILTKINEIEPYPEDKLKKATKGLLAKPTNEEVLKLGY